VDISNTWNLTTEGRQVKKESDRGQTRENFQKGPEGKSTAEETPQERFSQMILSGEEPKQKGGGDGSGTEGVGAKENSLAPQKRETMLREKKKRYTGGRGGRRPAGNQVQCTEKGRGTCTKIGKTKYFKRSE